MKYFHVIIEERNGEQEYSFPKVIKARTQASAEKKAEQLAQHWYDTSDGVPRINESGWFEHLDGCVAVRVDKVDETTPEEFFNYYLR